MVETRIKKISIFHKDRLVTRVIFKQSIPHIEHVDMMGKLILAENATIEDIEDFLSSRVFPNRNDESTKDELRKLGLDTYDYLEIIRKTEGRMLKDAISVKLE